MTTINTSTDLLRLLREDPEFYDEVRRLILTDELIDLPNQFAKLVTVVTALSEKFAAFAKATDGRLATLETHSEKMDTFAEETNRRLTSLETHVAALQGSDLERRARRNILNIASASLGLTGGRILIAQGRDPSQGFVATINQAEENGLVTPQQADHVLLADIIIYARRQNTYAVFEVSRTINRDDLRRARDRAAAVATSTGAITIPAVVGQVIHLPQQSQADTMGVRVIIPAIMRPQEAETEQ